MIRKCYSEIVSFVAIVFPDSNCGPTPPYMPKHSSPAFNPRPIHLPCRPYHRQASDINKPPIMSVVQCFAAVIVGTLAIDKKEEEYKYNTELWRIIFEYTGDPSKASQGSQFLDELYNALEPKHGKIIREIAKSLAKKTFVFTTLMSYFDYYYNMTFEMVPPLVKPKSFAGNLFKIVALKCRQLDLSESISLCERMKSESSALLSSYNMSINNTEMTRFEQMLAPIDQLYRQPDLEKAKSGDKGKSAADMLQSVYAHDLGETSAEFGFNTPGFNSQVAQDLEAMQYLSHRNCDLALMNNQSNYRGGELGLADLSYSYASQGYLSASLEALYESFISDRMNIVREMKDDPNSAADQQALRKRSRMWNRRLVGWLASLMTYYGRDSRQGSKWTSSGEDRFKGIPPALDYSLPDLVGFLMRTANTLDEKVDSSVHGLESFFSGGESLIAIPPDHIAASYPHPPISGKSSPDLSDLARVEKLLFDFSSMAQEGHILQFSRLVSQFYAYFGFEEISQNYARTAAKLCTHIADVRSAGEATIQQVSELSLWCEIKLRAGLYHDQIIQSLYELAGLKQQGFWTDDAQITYSLLLGVLLVKSHAPRAGRTVLDQLKASSTLPKSHQDGLKYAEVLLLIYTSQFQAAAVLAQRYAREFMHAKSTKDELFFLTKAARALVLSQSSILASQAHILICNTLSRALALNNMALVFELVLLRARLFYNSRDRQSCSVLCHSIEHLFDVSASHSLRIEWTLLTQASSRTAKPVDPRMLALCIYTEFNLDISKSYSSANEFNFTASPDADTILTIAGVNKFGKTTINQDSKNKMTSLLRPYFAQKGTRLPSFEVFSWKLVDTYAAMARESTHEPTALSTKFGPTTNHFTSTPIARNVDGHSPLGGSPLASAIGVQHNQKRIRDALSSPSRSSDTKRRSVLLGP